MSVPTHARTRRSSSLLAIFSVAILAMLLLLNGRSGVHADPLPLVSIQAPEEPFYNEPFDFTVLFDNTDNDEVGYGPFIDVELPPSLAYNGAKYLTVSLDDTTFICALEGQYTHPLTGQVRLCTPGNTVAVIVLPFGSFVPDQPAAPITIASFVNSGVPAIVGVAQPIQATGGFRFGNLPTGSTPLWQGGATLEHVVPTIVRLRKEYVGPEDETATGPNFPRQYRIIADIADGQTLTAFDLVDRLPNDLAFLSATPVTADGGMVTEPAVGVPSNGSEVRARWATITGSLGDHDAEMTVDFFAPLDDANTLPVLDAASGAPVPTPDDASASGTWTATSGLVTSDAQPVDHTLMLRSLAIQKSVDALGGDPVKPGDHLEWTLEIQVSDYFAFQDLNILDEFTDGQDFDTTFAPTLSWQDSGGRSGAGSFTLDTDYTVTEGAGGPPGGSASPVRGRVTFDISSLLAATGGDGRLVGGCVPLTGVPEPDEGDPWVPDCVAYNNGQTTATIVFRTVVRQQYDYLHTEGSGFAPIVQGDSVSNSVEIWGDVLSIGDAVTPTGHTVTDTSGDSVQIPVGNVQKSIVAINGVPLVGDPWLEPGDEVTYRIRYDLPITRFENFRFTDYLPLPVFASAEGGATWTQGADGVAPPAGQWALGSANTFVGILPTVTSTAAPANTLTFDYGDYEEVLSPETVVEVLFTVTVRDDPFADGLFLTNQVRATESSTEAHVSDADAIIQIRLGQPDVQIVKGVIDAPAHATLDAECAVPTPLTSYLDEDVDCDVYDVDAGDTITYVVVLDNIGHAPAHNLTVKDVLPDGLANPTLVSVADGAGVPLASPADYGGDFFDAGIEFVAPVAGLTPDVPSDGTNIRVLTFTAEVVDTVTPGETLTNTATITKYAGQPGATNHLPLTGRSDDANATVKSAQIAKSIIATSEVHTAGIANVAIGEVVTYQVVATFPEGVAENAVIKDTLPTGMRFLQCILVDPYEASAGLTVETPGCTNTGTNTNLIFDFGDVENPGTAASTGRTITIRYDALIENVAANVRGMDRTNSATLEFEDGSAGPATTTVTIVEPTLTITKEFEDEFADALDVTSITLTVEHTGSSNTTAFDVVLSDVLSDHLEYVPGSIDCTGTTVWSTCEVVGQNVNAAWASITTAQTATITLDVTVLTSVGTGGSISNTADILWTSLPGTNGSAAPGGAGTSTGERTGSGGVNSYNASGTDTLSIFGFAPGKSLRRTSEAHTGEAGGTERVAIGEVVTYRLVVDIAEGETSNVSIIDRLPAGTRYLGNARLALVSDDGASLTSDSLTIDDSLAACGVAGTEAPEDLDDGCVLDAANISTAGDNGDDVTFTLGTLTNGDDDSDKELAIIEYDVLVLNVVSNQANTPLVNNFIVRIDGVQQGSPSDDVTVRVAEPVISIAKTATTPATEAGQGVVYTLVVSNTATGNNASAGFDLVVTDSLPASLTNVAVDAIDDIEYDAASCGDVVMSHTVDVTGNDVTVNLTCLNPGEDVTITITADVVDNAEAGLLIRNEAQVVYSSLPGARGTGNAAPGGSGDSDGERNGGGDPDDEDDPNDYVNTANASFSLTAPTIDKGNPDPSTATIGETVTWDILLWVPDGVTTDLVVTDHLPAGLTLVDPDGVQLLTTAAAAPGLITTDFAGTVVLGAIGGTKGDITIDLGNVVATADGNTNNNFVLRVTAHVDNVLGNQRTNTRLNAASATFEDPETGETAITDPTPPTALTIVEPELRVVKTVDTTGGREAGNVVEYELVIDHLGTSDSTAYDVEVADTLPALLELDRGSITVTPAGACVGVGVVGGAGNTWTLAVAEMGLDCVITVVYEAGILVGVNPGQAMVNDASATWKSIDNATGAEGSGRTGADGPLGGGSRNDYSAQDVAQFLIGGAFSILKELGNPDPDEPDSDNPDTLGDNLAIGETVTFTLTAQVLSGTIDNVRVTDAIPAGMRFLPGTEEYDFTGSGLTTDVPTATCAGVCGHGDDVTFDFGTVVNPPGAGTGSFTITFDVVIVDIPANERGDILTNIATLFYDDAGGDEQSVVSPDVDVTIVEPVLVVRKSFDRPVAAANETVQVTIEVENTGDAPAYNVELSDVLAGAPNALINPEEVSSTHGLTWATVGTTVSYTGGEIPAGGIATVIFEVDLASTVVADAVIPNTAEAFGTTMPGDDATYPEQRTTPTVDDDASIEVSAPDLVVTKDDGVADTAPGTDIVYTITYENVGDADATGVVISETVPANTTFNAGASHPDWVCVGSACTIAIGTVAAGAPADTVLFAVTVSNPVPAGLDDIVNTVTIADDGDHGPDRTPGDNSDTETTPLDAVPNLRIQKTDGGLISYPGGPIVYTLNYSNIGAQGATGVVITETVPAGVTFDAAGSHEDWVCGDVIPGSICTYAVGALGPGASGTVTFAVTVDDPSVVDPVDNTASITDDGTNGADPDLDDNSSDESTPIVDAVDLAVTKVVSGVPGIFLGDQVTFIVTVENLGPGGATGIVLSDVLSAGLTYVSQTGDGVYDAGAGTWAAGDLLMGESASISIRVRGDAVGTHTNTASVDSLNEVDINPANNSDSDTVTVFDPPVPPTPTPTPTSSPTATPSVAPTPAGPGTPTVKVGDGPEKPLEDGFEGSVKSTGGEVPITVTGITVGAGCDASLRIVDFDGTVYHATMDTLPDGSLHVDWVVPAGPAGTKLTVILVVDGTCDETFEFELGTISRYAPSGIIVDIVSSCPVMGAQVILQRLVDGEWIFADPARVEGGTAIMDPQVNPQYTLADGSYGWDVVAGEWRISVSHPDYYSQISRSVIIPPPVVDLHMFLEPIGDPLQCMGAPSPANTGHGPGAGAADGSDTVVWMALLGSLAGAGVAVALAGRRLALAVTGTPRR